MNSTSFSPLPRLEVLGLPRLLGPMGEALTGRKELALLAYVARRAPRPVPRDELAELFWGERGELRARQSLRQAVVKLRRAAGEGLVVTPEEVGLDTRALAVDMLDFESALRAGRLAEAVGLWRGEFLARMEEAGGEGFRTWLEAERERLRQRLAAALERLAAAAGEGERWEEAGGWAERWVEASPWEERAHAVLLTALVRAGRGEEARARYAAFAERLRSQLGTQPSAELARLLSAAPAAPRQPRPQLPAPGSVALFSPSLTGREGALAELSAAWQAVRAQGRALVVVEGEEGIGKTRLCEEFLRSVAASGEPALVLRARMQAEPAAEAEAPHQRELRALLSPLAGAPGLSGASDGALAALARWVPAIRERFPRLPDAPAAEPELHRALREVLDAVAAEVPLVLFVDDLPYAQPPTRRALLALARELPPGVLLLLTGRVEDLRRVSAAAAVAEIPTARQIILQPLSALEVEALVGSMLVLRPEVRRRLAARLHEATEGNPFFIVELLAGLADEGRLTLDASGVWRLAGSELAPLPIPAGVHDAVVQRLARLGEPARALLRAAALQGREFEVRPLEDAVALPHERFLEALDELVARRVLRRWRSGEGFEFAHDLVRRIVLERLPPERPRNPTAAAGGIQEPPTSGETVIAGRRATSDARRAPAFLRRSWSGAAAVAAALVLIVAVAFGLAGRTAAPAPLSPTTIAVLPFTVQGSAAHAYLGEGMVDLLSARLDGGGELASVEPRALLAATRARRPAGDLDLARQIARQVGAGLFVLGSVVEVGGRLQLNASLYDAGGELRQMAQTEAADESHLFDLVDELARQLLAGWYQGPAAPLVRTASVTTASLPALKAYLEGERLLRMGRFADASAAFSTAIEADTTFALAHYRLSVALEWVPVDYAIRIDAVVAGAQRHAHRLPHRLRLLVEASAARRQGEMLLADSLYGAVLDVSRHDFEATFQRAEVRFHDFPLRGQSVSGSKGLWQKVLTLDPGNAFALVHLVRIAASEDSLAHFLRQHARAVEAVPFDDRRGVELHFWRALAEGTPLDAERLGRWIGAGGFLPFGQIVTFSRDLDASERQFSELRSFHTGNYQEATASAHLLAARGRWQAADSVFRAAESAARSRVLPHHVLLASFAPLRPSVGDVSRLRHAVARWPEIEHPDENPALRPYLLGLLAAAAGGPADLLGYAAELESAREVPLAHDLALTLRAEAARRRGEPARALRLLEEARMQASWDQSFNSPFHSRVHTRWLRAELLRELGRDREALDWYATLGQASPYEIAFLAPAHLRRAEIHERLGEREPALEHYRRFLDLWRDADPELRPLVREVEARVGRLAGASRPR